MSYFKPNIDAMAAYVPGEQPTSFDGVVKINTNENAYPPSPKVAEALRTFDPTRLRLYPDQMCKAFRKAASRVLDVPAEWILPGNGSDDLLVMISRACLGPGRRAAYPIPTFTFYETQARIEGAEYVELELGEDWLVPVEGLLETNAAVTFLANPNSPTGRRLGNDQLVRLAEGLDGLLVIDEAYADFAGETALELVRRYENVVILRTMSKGYALAGLRFGWAIAQPPVLEGLLKTKQIYNVDSLAMTLATAAMNDQDYKNESTRRIVASRGWLARELTRLGWSVWPSETNFLLAQPPTGAQEIYDALKQRRILVRYFKGARLGDTLRITVGSEDENRTLVDALEAIQAGE